MNCRIAQIKGLQRAYSFWEQRMVLFHGVEPRTFACALSDLLYAVTCMDTVTVRNLAATNFLLYLKIIRVSVESFICTCTCTST